MKKYLLILLLSLPFIENTFAQVKPPSHEIYDKLLKKNVTAGGKVNYKAFIKDSVEFNKYLTIISNTRPDEKTWTKNERMAFWINAYNAFTIKLIIKNYPVKSIKDINKKKKSSPDIPWKIKFFKMNGKRMCLDNIGHDQLRKKFDDPRVHMTLASASKSCPVLLNEAYDSKRLDQQMAKQAKTFLSNPLLNKITANHAKLSMIFKWYILDFDKNKEESIRTFINTYSRVKINPKTTISYLEYDWSLNE
jgi:hypothetical protein